MRQTRQEDTTECDKDNEVSNKTKHVAHDDRARHGTETGNKNRSKGQKDERFRKRQKKRRHGTTQQKRGIETRIRR